MDTQIIERLCKLRKEHGYSQEQLADELGVSRQAVSKWERGEASPDTDNLIALARLYGVSMDDLLFEKSSTEHVVQSVEDKKVCDVHKDGKERGNHDSAVGAIGAATVMLCCIVYFTLGGAWGLWHPSWLVFLAIPVIPSLAGAIKNKDPHIFCFPVFVVAVYLLLGLQWGLWHPWWVIFLTIPVYYVATDFIKKK